MNAADVRASAPRPPAHRPRRRARLAVGLLGGSFNPAHGGHRYLSALALSALALDQVWWLVSPQNPLKPEHGMAPYPERLAGARALARHPRLRVSDLEARLGTRYSVETIAALRACFPSHRFVWIMGADNLEEIPRWHRWEEIFATVPVAVFNRPSYAVRALSGAAAQRFRGHRVAAAEAATLKRRRPPAWLFLWRAHHPASATALRDGRGGVAE